MDHRAIDHTAVIAPRRRLFAMRLRGVLACALALGACGNDKTHLHPDGVIGDMRWQPAPGETKNWDIQVAAPFDFSTPRQMMMVDLWTSVPADTTISYGDGSSVAVPAGAQQQTIATLGATQTVVICRVGLGGMRTTDPDAARFPEASRLPLDAKTPSDEYILDLGDRTPWEEAALARIDLAKQIGCDGIEPYRIDQFGLDPTLTLDEQRSWYSAVALAVHERDLSVGMRNGPELYQAVAGLFDWAIIERCAEDDICDQVRPVLEQQKAVFALDYTTDFFGDPQDPLQLLCPRQTEAGIQDGLVKNAELSSAARVQCE